MDFYSPRKLIFKAWNKETRLLVRLETIPCSRGELIKKDHIFLQFTGLYDKQEEELYEMDIVLLDSGKYLVRWSHERSGWILSKLPEATQQEALTLGNTTRCVRFCNYFESGERD
jgi:hypothetical protein